MSDPEYPSYAQLCQFVREAERYPRLSDPIPAHRYAGWALPMIMDGHRLLDVPDRWGYHLRILKDQRLPDEPIPQIQFLSGPHPETLKHLHQWIRLAAHHQSTWTGMTDLIDWMAYALCVSPKPPRLEDAIQADLYQQVNFLELVLHPYDYFGDIICEGIGDGKWANPGAFFPTPMDVCRLMAQMILPDLTNASRETLLKFRTAKIADNAGSGTGRMLLLGSNVSLSIFGIERDLLVRTASLINGALYAPWITFPIPTHILAQAPFCAETLVDDEPESAVAMPAPSSMASITCLMPPPISPMIGEESEPPSQQLVFPGW